MSIKRHEQSKILSQAVEYGNLVHLAGVCADDSSKTVKGQTEEILKKIDALLAKCGSNKSKILSATIWVVDIRHRAEMNEVWCAWVDPANMPARACVEAKLADPKLLVEIMVVATK